MCFSATLIENSIYISRFNCETPNQLESLCKVWDLSIAAFLHFVTPSDFFDKIKETVDLRKVTNFQVRWIQGLFGSNTTGYIQFGIFSQVLSIFVYTFIS